MNNILKEINPESINYFIESNLDDFYTQASKHPNFVSRIEEKISWVLARNADWPECIFRANFENSNIKKEIDIMKEIIRNGEAPNGWTVGPLTKPNNLGALLEKYGFSNVYHQAGMAVELKDIEKNEINNLIIKKVDTEESLRNWSWVVSRTFGIKVDFDFLKALCVKGEIQFYLGKLEGKSVSTLMLYFSSGVVGLHAVSTLPEYRNKGFGFSISRKALKDAFSMGYYVGVLQASSLGERVYRKLGFQKYCDIISYALDNDKKK